MPTVKVRSVAKDGFWRAGRKWSYEFGEPVDVTADELRMLQNERELHVQVVSGGGDEAQLDELTKPEATHKKR